MTKQLFEYIQNSFAKEKLYLALLIHLWTNASESDLIQIKETLILCKHFTDKNDKLVAEICGEVPK